MEVAIQNYANAPLFSFCVTCMNRLEHLSETLPANLDAIAPLSDIELLILDYNSSDGLAQWLSTSLPDYVSSARIIAFQTVQPLFYQSSHAKNVIHRLAQGRILVNLDADQFLTEEYIAFLRQHFSVEPCILHGVAKSTSGRVAIRREHFFGIGGYDEDFEGWGSDDTDLVARAARRYDLAVYGADPALTPCIAHDDELRIRCMQMKDVRRSSVGNWRRSRSNVAAGKFVANLGRSWGEAPVRRIPTARES